MAAPRQLRPDVDYNQFNKEALYKRVDHLTSTMTRSFLSIMQGVTKRDEPEKDGEGNQEDPDKEYGAIIAEEAMIKQHTSALIKAVQDTSTLIRELQELWLFGRLDTLQDPADAEAARTRAVEIGKMVEQLSQMKTMAEEFTGALGENESSPANGNENGLAGPPGQASPPNPGVPSDDPLEALKELERVEPEEKGKGIKKKKKNKHNNRKKGKDGKEPVATPLVPYSSDSDSPSDKAPTDSTSSDQGSTDDIPTPTAGTPSAAAPDDDAPAAGDPDASEDPNNLNPMSQETQASYVTAMTHQTDDAYFSALED